MTQPTPSAQNTRPKALSPDVAEILKMLDALETAAKDQQPVPTRT